MHEIPIGCVVEGLVDEAVVRKLFSDLSLPLGPFYRSSIPAFEGKHPARTTGHGARPATRRVRRRSVR